MDNSMSISLQQRFLQRIKEIIPENHSLVDELSDILEISNDSAYRRLRGETSLNIEEVAKLCDHYKLSFDSINAYVSNTVTFAFDMINEINDYKKNLTNICKELERISKSKEKNIYYAAVDLPIFYNFNFPTLGAFKSFYWLKSVLNCQEYESKKFNKDYLDIEFTNLGENLFKYYAAIPSVEIWDEGTINSVLKQIEYYWWSGLFEDPNDANLICDELIAELSLVQRQAELSRKLIDENIPGGEPNNYSLYISEIEIGNNCILTSIANEKSAYLSHNTFNNISTVNKAFCDSTEKWFNNFIKKSTLISGVSEKQRYQFFSNAKQKVENLKKKINHTS